MAAAADAPRAAPCRSGRARRRWRNCRRCCGRRSGRSPSSAAAAGPSGRARPSPGSPSASTCRSPARFAGPAPSTASTTTSPARSASPPIRSSRRASKRPILFCSSAAACPRRRRRAIRCSRFPRRGNGSSMSMPTPHEIGRNYHPALGIIATSPEFCAALEGVEPPRGDPLVGRDPQARADYLAWSEQAPANPGRVQLARSCSRSGGARLTPFSPMAPATSRSGSAASFAFAGSSSSSVRPRARWASACRRRSARRGCSRNGRSSVSPATATF